MTLKTAESNREIEITKEIPTSEEVVLSIKENFEKDVKPEWIEWSKEISVIRRSLT